MGISPSPLLPSNLTPISFSRQINFLAKILFRLDGQNRPLAQHNWSQDLLAILVLENPRLRSTGWLVTLRC